jgi:hypothetical protein
MPIDDYLLDDGIMTLEKSLYSGNTLKQLARVPSIVVLCSQISIAEKRCFVLRGKIENLPNRSFYFGIGGSRILATLLVVTWAERWRTNNGRNNTMMSTTMKISVDSPLQKYHNVENLLTFDAFRDANISNLYH